MVLWFERTLEFLKIWDETSLLVPELVEEFYDTAVVICRSNSRDGVKQLLDSFLFHLGYIIAEKWPAFHIQLEAIKTFNHILDHISREDKKSLQSSEEMSTLLKTMARKLFEVGDYDGQVAISEALCRMAPRKMRENLVRHWFDDTFFANAFLDINDKDFETDCRIFLNCLNLRSQDTVRVYTYPCIDAFADTEKLIRPQDSKLEHFWIDFNIGSNTISFYIQNPKGVLWDSVRLPNDSIAGYSLQELGKHKQLDIYPKTHIVINTKETKHVRIYFENEHDIESAVVKTYGEEMKMLISNQDTNNESASQANSPTSIGTFVESKPQLWQMGQSKLCKTDEASSEELHCQSNECPPSEVNTNSTGKDSGSIKPQDALKDLTEVNEPSNLKNSPVIICRDVRVVLSPVLKRIMDHTHKDVKATCSETKGSTPKKQHAEKSLSKFEYPNSSQSGTDIELVIGTVESPTSSAKRTLVLTPSRPITRASLTDQKKPQTVRKKNVISSESAAESEKSWIVEHKKSADYSRKKTKPKSKLKVLPLSSESSNEDMLKNMPRSSSFTVLKQTKPGKGRAESLSFSDVNLSGVSGLLTPGNTTRQSSALTISDVDDKDIMDPVQEMSSPEFVPQAKNSEDFQWGFSSTNVIKAVAEDDTEPQQKRKRLNSGEIALMFQPRKLFVSCEKNSEEAPSSSHAEDLAGCSFVSSFDSFTKQLQTKMASTYKNLEIQAQDMLTASHLHVSNLISQIQECKTRKLNRFHEIVVQELSTLEADTQALRELEKETLEIWENQTLKIKQFCVNQSKRLEALLGETNSLTKNNDQLTDVTESSEKPTKD
ncbi:synaptonemal complex protein 2-like isoform X1 [Lithobates pipiens]